MCGPQTVSTWLGRELREKARPQHAVLSCLGNISAVRGKPRSGGTMRWLGSVNEECLLIDCFYARCARQRDLVLHGTAVIRDLALRVINA